MSDLTPSRIWAKRATFGWLVLGLLFAYLLPLQTAAGGLIWPDFILAFALAWSVRRPDFVPPALLAPLFLIADLLLQRPPGLWAVLALIACNQMQIRARTLRDGTLMAEFLAVAFWIVAVGLGYRLVLALLLVDMPALGPSLVQIVVTVLAYPLVVAITHVLMGVRKPAPGEYDSKGVRI